MDNKKEFDGSLLSVCDYLEISEAFGRDVLKLFAGIRVKGIECDSRELKEGEIFVARKGAHYNPFAHMQDIREKHPAAVIIEAEAYLNSADGERFSNAVKSTYGEEDRVILKRQGRLALPGFVSDPERSVAELKAVSVSADGKAVRESNLILLVLPTGKSLSSLAGFIYKNPTDRIRLIGVTGTNGKSTVTQMIAQMLTSLGHSCAVFGTTGYGLPGKLVKSANTTPDAVFLQKKLASFAAQGIEYAVLEVSSIGFCENRVSGLNFYAGAFTNLTQDHLDYHVSMEDYRSAKLSFLKSLPPFRCIINVSDETGNTFASELSKFVPVSVRPGQRGKFAGNGLSVEKVTTHRNGSEIFISSPENGKNAVHIDLNLLGLFNADNFAVAAGVMMSLGFSLKKIAAVAPEIRPVTGRMERFAVPGKPSFIVDYAHTPDGVEKALRAARAHMESSSGKLFIVVGCGGDRDRSKRPLMAVKASVFADYAVFTSDNPRTEKPERILGDMLTAVIDPAYIRSKADGDDITQPFMKESEEEYMSQPLPEVGSAVHNVVVIPDRAAAVRYAFKHAGEHDCILIAGKGHEDYQIFADRTIHFSDRELCKELLGITAADYED